MALERTPNSQGSSFDINICPFESQGLALTQPERERERKPRPVPFALPSSLEDRPSFANGEGLYLVFHESRCLGKLRRIPDELAAAYGLIQRGPESPVHLMHCRGLLSFRQHSRVQPFQVLGL